jgi:hypothetical protein
MDSWIESQHSVRVRFCALCNLLGVRFLCELFWSSWATRKTNASHEDAIHNNKLVRIDVFPSRNNHCFHNSTPILIAMEQIRRRNLEVAQFKQLCALKKYIHRHSPPTIDDSELEALGVLKRTDLDVDNSSPCDFEPRFFSPWYDGDSDLKEEGDGARVYWSETLDRDKDHPEWIPNAGYKYPEMRARWFNRVCFRLARDHEDDKTHPMFVAPHRSLHCVLADSEPKAALIPHSPRKIWTSPSHTATTTGLTTSPRLSCSPQPQTHLTQALRCSTLS